MKFFYSTLEKCANIGLTYPLFAKDGSYRKIYKVASDFYELCIVIRIGIKCESGETSFSMITSVGTAVAPGKQIFMQLYKEKDVIALHRHSHIPTRILKGGAYKLFNTGGNITV